MLKFNNIFKQFAFTVKRIHDGKFFYSSLAVVGFCAVSFMMLYLGSAPYLVQLKEGDVSLRTIYAPYDYTYPTSIDEAKTEKARKDAEAKILPVYDIGAAEEERAVTRIDDIFDLLEDAKNKTDIDNKEKIGLLRAKIDKSQLADKELLNFLELASFEEIRKAGKHALENIFLVGVFEEEEKAALLKRKVEGIIMRVPHMMMERTIGIKDLVDKKEAESVVSNTLDGMIPKNRAIRRPVFNLVKNEIVANATYNEEVTKDRIERARGGVKPAYKREVVKKNELIVDKGKRLTQTDISKLTQITLIHSVVNRTSYLSGLFLLLALLTLVVCLYLVLMERRLVLQPKHSSLIALNSIIIIILSLVIIQSQLSIYLIPLAGICMILALLLNVNVALITSMALSIYIGFMAGGKLDLSLVLFIGSAIGIYAVRGARRRSQIFFAGFAIFLLNIISIAGIGFLNNFNKEAILAESLYGGVSGIVSSFIVIGLLPVFEYVFNLITNITLLELSDSSHPILKELTIKAPGTYHHSILVGNLAEEACNAIGANALLARVGSYYHDIGKIEKAEYFVENEMGTASKHDRLAPSMSALIITSHTKDGVELAKKHKLNSAIIDFIGQHHGTGLIYYFYHRALEKINSEDELEEGEFRYQGPKPQTKETAVVLLADSVEASSRMLSDPTPARIRGLVQKIINNKFIDGQLDECDLTLRDLNKIADGFVRVLTGVFHTRVEYPEVRTKKDRKNGAHNKNK
ncbi:MAG: HDIG domain-containing metalloprotein [Candidatus Omnitrophota bacterium]